jgi:arginase family enzyme
MKKGVIQTFKYMGRKPKDLKDKKDQNICVAWLDAHGDAEE